MNKALYVGTALIFSISIFVSSFFYFGLESKVNGNVMGLKSSNNIQIPQQSTFINEENSESESSVTFTTDLSYDQILKYYSELASLQGWEKTSELTKYIKGTELVEIKIEPESEGRNLVRMEHKVR